MEYEEKRKRSAAGICLSLLGVILMIVPFLLALSMFVPKMAGYAEYTVVTESMEPEIPVGSLVFVKAQEPETLEEGDVISYEKGNGIVITHRIVENSRDTRTIITKGDANQGNDLEPVEYDSVIGKVAKTIPKVGVLAARLSTLAGKILLGALLITGYLLTVLASRL